MASGKGQAIRRSIVQLKTIQAVRRSRAARPDHTRNLALGVCDSIQFTTGSTGKPVGHKTTSGHSAIATATTIVGCLLLLVAVSLSVAAALAQYKA